VHATWRKTHTTRASTTGKQKNSRLEPKRAWTRLGQTLLPGALYTPAQLTGKRALTGAKHSKAQHLRTCGSPGLEVCVLATMRVVRCPVDKRRTREKSQNGKKEIFFIRFLFLLKPAQTMGQAEATPIIWVAGDILVAEPGNKKIAARLELLFCCVIL